jgi:hypothetical protein
MLHTFRMNRCRCSPEGGHFTSAALLITIQRLIDVRTIVPALQLAIEVPIVARAEGPEAVAAIDAYRRGVPPLSVPVAAAAAACPCPRIDRVSGQAYLEFWSRGV